MRTAIAVLLCVLPLPLVARGVVLEKVGQIYEGASAFDYRVDENGSLRFVDVEKGEGFRPFQTTGKEVPNFGFSRRVNWVRMEVQNRTSHEDWLIQIAYPPLDRVDLFYRNAAGELITMTAGDSFPFLQRPILHHTLVFPVKFGKAPERVYLRFQTEGSHEYPIRILTEESLRQNDRYEMFVHGLYYGIILILALYNLILFAMVLDRSFLYYFLYITGFGLIVLILDGFAFELFWPDFPWWQNRSLPFAIGWTFFWSLAFAGVFLNIRSHSRIAWRLMGMLMGAMALLMALALFLPYHWTIHISAVLVISFSVVVLISSVYSVYRGFRPARYFLVAWVTLLVGVSIYSLKGFGILPANFLSDYSLQIGSAVEMSLLSLGLGNRMQVMAIEKEKAVSAAAESRRLFQEMELKSSRLELELLKKNIEPHFLMNSLNAMVFLLEENPRKAAALLENLAGELRIMLSISGRGLIELEQEIELCRRHLSVMGLRQDSDYSFEVDGSVTGRIVPPLILHTLVENGIRHGFRGRTSGKFFLAVSQSGAKVRYVLENNGSRERESRGEGVGFRYIRARLEEVCPGAWSLESGPMECGWRNVLEMEV